MRDKIKRIEGSIMAGSISIWGLGGGTIDTQNLIDLELYALEMKKLPFTSRQTSLTALQKSYQNFKSALQEFTDMLSSYSLSSGTDKSTTYSTNGYVTASATSSAISGSYSIEVTQLATRHQLQAELSDVSEPLKQDGKIVINDIEIEVTSDMSASDILRKINNAGAGVNTYSINNTMFMVSDMPGSDSTIELDDSDGILESLGFKGETVTETKPQDAIFIINGVEVTRQSNTVTDVLPGVTLELTKETEGKAIELVIENGSAEELFNQVSEFVEAYNNARSTLSSFIGDGGALSGKAATRSLQSVLSSMFNFERNGIYNFTIGMSVDKDGILSLDEDLLKEAIANNQNAVEDYFFGIGGLTGTMNLQMNKVFGASGVVTTELDGISTQLADIEKKLENIDSQNAILEETIIERYASFEMRMGSLNAQLQLMQSLIEGLNNKDS